MYEISIIIPCYNASKYISRAVDSVENQIYSKSIEVIIIDDGSSDDSFEICKQLENKYDNVKVYCHGGEHRLNKGVIESRNLGIIKAKGKWITFLDADDEIDSAGYCDFFDCIKEGTISDIIIAGFSFVIDGEEKEQRLNIAGNYEIAKFAELMLSDIPWNNISCVGAKFYNKDFLTEGKIKFNHFYEYNEDGGFIVEALAKANHVTVLNQIMYRYIIRDNSRNSAYRPNQFYSIVEVYKALQTFFAYHNVAGKEKYIERLIANLVCTALRNYVQYEDSEGYESVYDELQQNSDAKKATKYMLKPFMCHTSKKMYVFCVLFLLKSKRITKKFLMKGWI